MLGINSGCVDLIATDPPYNKEKRLLVSISCRGASQYNSLTKGIGEREILFLLVLIPNGLAQLALSDVFACAKPSPISKKRKIVYEQSSRSLKPFVTCRSNVRVAVD